MINAFIDFKVKTGFLLIFINLIAFIMNYLDEIITSNLEFSCRCKIIASGIAQETRLPTNDILGLKVKSLCSDHI